MRGLDLEPTDTLLRMHWRGLGKISNRLAALASEAPPELDDALAVAAVDLDRHVALVEVIESRLARNQ